MPVDERTRAKRPGPFFLVDDARQRTGLGSEVAGRAFGDVSNASRAAVHVGGRGGGDPIAGFFIGPIPPPVLACACGAGSGSGTGPRLRLAAGALPLATRTLRSPRLKLVTP
jgi:hypothetical protein